MELFIPSLFVFILAILVCFILIPRFTPLITAILALGLLSYGVYDHYKLFATEYRLSTWQESLKIYAPAIMIGALILFIIYSIIIFFSKGSVPIPSAPNIASPPANTATNTVTEHINNVTSGIANTLGNITDGIANQVNNITGNNGNNKGNGNNNGNKGNRGNNKGNGNNLSRSFLETI